MRFGRSKTNKEKVGAEHPSYDTCNAKMGLQTNAGSLRSPNGRT